jgi:hypothetical protein
VRPPPRVRFGSITWAVYVDPKPSWPNSEGSHYTETLHPLIEPFDLKGVGFTTTAISIRTSRTTAGSTSRRSGACAASRALQYDEPTPMIPGIVMADIQLSHATKGSVPSHRFPGEAGWYWHRGEKSGTIEDELTMPELIASGR